VLCFLWVLYKFSNNIQISWKVNRLFWYLFYRRKASCCCGPLSPDKFTVSYFYLPVYLFLFHVLSSLLSACLILFSLRFPLVFLRALWFWSNSNVKRFYTNTVCLQNLPSNVTSVSLNHIGTIQKRTKAKIVPARYVWLRGLWFVNCLTTVYQITGLFVRTAPEIGVSEKKHEIHSKCNRYYERDLKQRIFRIQGRCLALK
jgi:hypothetical protein